MANEATSTVSEIGLSRRQALYAGGAVLAAGGLAFAGAARAEHEGHDHGAHDHGSHDHHAHGEHGKADSQHQALIEAAQHCMASAEACVPHCISLLGKGDTSLAECLESVLAISPVCGAVARLASLDAPRLKDLAKVCSDICADCEKVCRKHAEHHKVCKDCADSCAAFVKEAKKLTDA